MAGRSSIRARFKAAKGAAGPGRNDLRSWTGRQCGIPDETQPWQGISALAT